MAWRILEASGKAVCAGLILVVLLAAACPRLLAPCDPQILAAPYLPPGGEHFLGTNGIGQDLLSLLIFSVRTSLSIGLLTALLTISVGTLVGLIGGALRGFPDELLMRMTDLFMLLPGLPLIILLTAYLNPGAAGISLVIACTAWPSTARVVRSKALQVREAGFVRSARGLGAGPFYIMARHILPNVIEIVLAKGLLAAAGAMMAEAGVSFLGLSDPGFVSWGAMIHDALVSGALINGCTWWYLPPVGCISASVVALTLTGQWAERFMGPAGLAPQSPLPVAPGHTEAGSGELLRVEELSVDFIDRSGTTSRALDCADICLPEKARIAVVGQTGSGKSVLLLTLLRLLPENAVASGRIFYRGLPLLHLAEHAMAKLRGRELAYVPQGTGDALNPLLTVGEQIAECARVHLNSDKAEAREKAVSLLAAMSIEKPEERFEEYPHRYSGGMIQRALLAVALACEPRLLLMDEPTKGLDPDSREAILHTLSRMQSRSVLVVTHDLKFAERFATHVVVMHASRILEAADRSSFFDRPLHPYSRALLAAQPERGMKAPEGGSHPGATETDGPGCPFRSWCAEAFSNCTDTPPLVKFKERRVRCWLYGPNGA